MALMTDNPRDLLDTAALIADGDVDDLDTLSSPAASGPEARALADIAQIAAMHKSWQQHRDEVVQPPLQPGDRWGGLEVIEIIGQGANGALYRAFDPTLQRDVALKLLFDRRNDEAISLNEARQLARIQHRAVATVHGATRDDGVSGIWMELIHGQDLEEHVENHGPFGAVEVAAIGREICFGIAAMHQQKVLHRDIKASNVMREQGGRIVLADLGSAVHAGGAEQTAGSMCGTPLYMAPEVLDGKPASMASDVYAAGVTLYYLLTGEHPVDVRRDPDTGALERGQLRHLADQRPDLPAELVAVIERALATDPSARFPSAGAMATALQGGVADDRLAGASPRSRRVVGVTAVAVTAVILMAVLAAGAYLLGGGRAAPAAAEATSPLHSVQPLRVAVLPVRGGSATIPSNDESTLIQGVASAELARHPALAVFDPNSLNRLIDQVDGADSLDDARQVAASEGVDVVVDPAVRDDGSGTRVIEFGLVDLRNRQLLGTDSFVLAGGSVAAHTQTAIRALLGPLQRQLAEISRDADVAAFVVGGRPYHEEAVAAFLRGVEFAYELQPGGESHFRRAVELAPGFRIARAWLGSALLGRGARDEARQQLEILEGQVAEATPLEDALIDWLAARVADDSVAAESSLERALRYAPGNNVFLTQLAGWRARRGDYAGALEALELPLRAHFNVHNTAVQAAWAAIETGDYDRAATALHLAAGSARTPRDVHLVRWALSLLEDDERAARQALGQFEARSAGPLDEDAVYLLELLADEAARRGNDNVAAHIRTRIDAG